MVENISLNLVQALNRALKFRTPVLRAPDTPFFHVPTNEEKLLNITGRAHDVLFKAKTVFPLDLFPDTVTIDREKLSIVQRFFFFTAKIISVPIRDILSIEANIGPFFGSVHMNSRYFSSNPYSINFLTRSNAVQLRRLLQGYIIAHEREIDCSAINKAELIYLLNDLGQGNID